MAPLNILSLNVQGLNVPQKRTKAFRSFQTQKAHIVCIQETHFTINSTPKFFSSSYPQVFTASANTKKRGTLVAFHRSTPITVHSEIKDPEGRYLILTGNILDTEVTVVSYYAPNKQPIPFLTHLLQVVNAHKMGTIIVCGDSNQVLLPFLDKTPYTSPRNQSKISLSQLLSKHNLVDSWRESNPTKRNYTYFSHPHQTFSRIDHIFLTTGMIPEILSSNIIPIPWSDHNAVLTTITSTIPKTQDKTWYLPEILLKQPIYRNKIEHALKEYFILNKSPEISPITLWEAHKPVLRGIFQQQIGILKRERRNLARKLETQFNSHFLAFQNNPNPITKSELEKARLEYDLFLTESTDKILRRSRHAFYMKSNKPGTYLAGALKTTNKSFKPIKLKISKNIYTSNPLKIVHKFRSHLKTLYTESNSFNLNEADSFFSKINLPELSDSQKAQLEEPIKVEDVAKIIKELKINKRPGPDGYSALYYRTFSDSISPILTETFNALLENNSFRQESLTAIICMIPKPHADDTSCTNYRPISMLNIDIKILAKILASRLGDFIGTLINRDQVGFMPTRQAGDNVRRAVLLAQIAKTRRIPSCFLSLDIQKAFDSISWPYLHYMLQKWGFGPNFVNWIKALYNKPKAYVKYAGYKSEAFNIERGTRQGCPVSPLLFALLIEPLAQRIRSEPTITGIEIGGFHHKLCLFADDILLFLSSPQISGPNLMPILDDFAAFSGLFINSKKCIALNISLSTLELNSAKNGLPFTWADKSIPYLGIHLTASYLDLFSANYPPMVKNITNMLKSWNHLPLSWFGKINTIKMTILPKLLYLFRVLPIPIPAYYLRIIQRKANSFIWGSSKPRTKLHTLYLPKLNGGLGCPNFASYYRAAHIATLTKYHTQHESPLWVSIEAADCDPLSIANLLWLSPRDRRGLGNPITKHFISMWDKYKLRNQLQSLHNPLLSFYKNPAFYPAWVSPRSFKAWITYDVLNRHKFVNSSSFIPFPTLCDKYGLPQSELFRYLQIFMPLLTTKSPLTQFTTFEKFCKDNPHAKGMISTLYAQLVNQPETEKPSYVQKWEGDLERTLETTEWNQIWLTTKSASPNILAIEANYKVLIRWYLVPVRIAKYVHNYSTECYRGCSDPGTHFHIWWSCPKAQIFWKAIFTIASKMLGISITPDPAMALINRKPEFLTHNQFKLLIQLFTAAKQTLAKAWRSPSLIVEEVVNRMNVTMTQAKMVAIDNDSFVKFDKIWQPWISNYLPSTFNKEVLLPW